MKQGFLHKNISKRCKVVLEYSLTALVTGLTNKIFRNSDTSLNNFDIDIGLNLVYFYALKCINVFAPYKILSKLEWI